MNHAKPRPTDRELLVDQARQHLEAAGRPRLVMLAILVATHAAGFFASAGLLHLGLDRMVIRYPLAVGVAFAGFLVLLRCWLTRQRAAVTIADDPEGLFLPGLAALGAAKLGAVPSQEEEEKRKGGWWTPDGLTDVGDPGEGCGVTVVVILMLVAALCSLVLSAYLVATSSALLAELVVDGAVLGILTRDRGPHWSRAIFDQTWPAALITALVLALVGNGLQHAAPGARTMGEAWAISQKAR